MKRISISVLIMFFLSFIISAQNKFNGLDMNIGNLFRLSDAKTRSNGWWGEGEIKFYIDGDSKFPTINGTGTEDYFCGSYDFDTNRKNTQGIEESQFTEFCTPYSGLSQIIRGDGHYNVMQRFGLYRWHIMDPIRFESDLKITIQDLGWHKGGRYLKQQSDIASTCFWYQTEPHAKFPEFPDWQKLEVN